MENQIEQIAQNVADEIKFENGVGIFSIAASARLVGVNESSIRRSAQNDGSMVKFLAQCGINLRQLDIGKNGVPDYVQ